MEKAYSWPDGHWDWPIKLPYKHGVKCGNMIFLGGQVALDEQGNVLHPGDVAAQTRIAMENIKAVLAGFGATLDDVVKVNIFYVGTGTKEDWEVAAKIRARDGAGRMYSIVVTAEGAEPAGGHRAVLEPAEIGHAERLGGIGERIAKALQERTDKDTRLVVLGHLLRGGSPTSFDRVAAMRFGTAAVRGLAEGRSGVMVALAFPNVNYVALEDVAGRMKGVPLDSDILQTGRDMGICFGD